MLDELTQYRRQRLVEEFKHAYKPFAGFGPYLANYIFFEGEKYSDVIFEGKKYSKFRFKIYVRVEIDCYKFGVHLVLPDSAIDIEALSILLELEEGFKYNNRERAMERIFDFKHEQELITYINNFKGKLERKNWTNQ